MAAISNLRAWLSYLAAAIRFITVLPAGPQEAYYPREMIAFFPAVGVILGLVLAAAETLCSFVLPPPVTAALCVLVLVCFTGAFHLDGLADTADGLFSHRDKDKTLLIMKDSRIGVMGAVALICVLLLKYSSFSALAYHGAGGFDRFIALMIIPAYSRAAMTAGVKFLPYARPGGGTAADLFEKPLAAAEFWGLGLCIFFSLFLGWQAIIINLVFFITCAGLILFYRRKINGITGDMLGALCEITETLLLISAAAVI
jgi:adenosylcobinamide-GDP ribazoletransferase